MPKSIECLRCHTPMEAGYVIDNTHGGNVQERWSPGKPNSSFWTGLKLEKEKLLSVISYRCPKCGMLESYAGESSLPDDDKGL